MEEVNRLIQFFFIIKTLTKISNGLRTYYVYGRVIVAKKICPKDKRRRLLLLKENQRLRSSPGLNMYMKIPKLPSHSNRTINGERYTILMHEKKNDKAKENSARCVLKPSKPTICNQNHNPDRTNSSS